MLSQLLPNDGGGDDGDDDDELPYYLSPQHLNQTNNKSSFKQVRSYLLSEGIVCSYHLLKYPSYLWLGLFFCLLSETAMK